MQIRVVDYRSNDAANEFSAGLKEIGFAVLSNHPINIELINEAYQKWYAFYSSDAAEKNKYAFDRKTHDGYVSSDLSETAKGNPIKDLKEFYHYYKNGRCPESLRDVTDRLYDAMSQLATELLGWIESNMPAEARDRLSMPLSEMIVDSTVTLFRLLHYPPLTGDEHPDALRAAAHEDINLITLLPAATAKGLQVLDAAGNWLDVPTNPGWLVINIGDMLQEATDHFYRSTTHRVVNPTGEDAKLPRLSMPLFLHPRDDVQLSGRHTAHSYRLERYAELGLL